MELAFLVYVISLLDNITVTLRVLAVCSGGFAFAYLLTSSDYHSLCASRGISEDRAELFKTNAAKTWKWFKIWVGIGVAFIGFANIIPSQKTAYMMIGAYAAQKVAENPKTIDMSSKVFKIIESNLDRYVDEEAKKAATPESKN